MKIIVVGAGTAGLIAALQIKKALPNCIVEVVRSGEAPIIGVGEGSTEHWTEFEKLVGFSRPEMIQKTKATYKFGIRFKDWRSKPYDDYFHSVSSPGVDRYGFNAGYALPVIMGKQLTPFFTNPAMREGFVVDGEHIHSQTNQFHFDTFLLNKYLLDLCDRSEILVKEAHVYSAQINASNGDILGLNTEIGVINGDFFVDATGFSRAVFRFVADPKWKSFSSYLPCDRAIATQTPEREDGVILPYTVAHALSSGWRWEIPTQERRGNGYVYSSAHCTEEQAIEELQDAIGYKIDDYRSFSFEAGYVTNPWEKNCCLVGLSSGFVEPLEATSIAASIQQSLALTKYLPVHRYDHSGAGRRKYNEKMSSMMENILVMIAMHYITDRKDTEMWKSMADREVPEQLREFIELIKLHGPGPFDLPTMGWELFHAPHFWHVAQGQGLLVRDTLMTSLETRVSLDDFSAHMTNLTNERLVQKLISHREALQRK
ncbi:MAG: tryptophan 7-halogenase [Bacteroidetes bacterium]|nr:tryptophan 7-halogenase [Bacteroidota bacterium]